MNLQEQCELGQSQLMQMDYLTAEATLEAAEKEAWRLRDFDTLCRLLLPLQEARRQRRQRCGEGIICMDFIARGPDDQLDAEQIVGQIPHGQILIAAWESVEPAIAARQLQAERRLYLDVFLGRVNGDGSVQIVAGQHSDKSIFPANLPKGRQAGNARTCALTMSLWEQLHAPFLAEADAQKDPLATIAAYRRTIEVDYACEFAHQRLADAIRMLK